jgi:hypothetical protein
MNEEHSWARWRWTPVSDWSLLLSSECSFAYSASASRRFPHVVRESTYSSQGKRC